LPISKRATKALDPNFVSPMQKTTDAQKFDTWFKSLDKNESDKKYKQYYEKVWDTKYKAAWEKKHPPQKNS